MAGYARVGMISQAEQGRHGMYPSVTSVQQHVVLQDMRPTAVACTADKHACSACRHGSNRTQAPLHSQRQAADSVHAGCRQHTQPRSDSPPS